MSLTTLVCLASGAPVKYSIQANMDPYRTNAEEPLGRNRRSGSEVPRIVRRRRISLARTGIVVLLIAVALVFFTIWYRAWPQRLDCQKLAQRLAVAMDAYRQEHQLFPAVLESLAVRPGRYGVDHYEYSFLGLVIPANLPEGTLVACCAKPHRSLLSHPWRHVLIISHGHISIQWLTEEDFQIVRARQRPPESY